MDKMNLEELVPKNKFDTESAEKLFQYSFDEIEPIIPQILEWMQDGNWPVSKPVGRYIKSLPQERIGPYIMGILDGTDYEWKYFLISIFEKADLEKGYLPLLAELKRLVNAPTDTEIACEVHWMAKHVLE